MEARVSSHGGAFPVTRWSLVLDAQVHSDNEPPARRALEEICRMYWTPLYAFVRRSGFGREDAEDLVQEFLARVLERDLLGEAAAEKGRLRSWLLALLKPFLLDRRKHDRAQKRGGGARIIPFDPDEADRMYGELPVDTTTPEELFERRWAMSVLGRALETLADEYAGAGRGEVYDELCQHLQWQGDGDCSYVESARRLGVSEGAVKVAVYRLRRRYREALRVEVAHTLGPDENVDEEIRHLLSVFGKS